MQLNITYLTTLFFVFFFVSFKIEGVILQEISLTVPEHTQMTTVLTHVSV